VDTASLAMKLSPLGVAVFVAYIVVVVTIGFISGRKGKEDTSHFFLAGRKLPFYVIGFSLIASSISTEQFLGEVGWGYRYGMAVCNWEWLYFIAQTMLIFFFLPIYMRNKIYTVPEFIRNRFGTISGSAFSVVCIAMYIVINLPLVLYSGAFLMNRIFDLNMYLGIWILVIAAGSYTIFGGLSAVAWVDLFNGALLIIGGLFVFFLGISKVPGGIEAVIGEGERAHLMLSAEHPDLPWTGMLALAFCSHMFYAVSNQFIIQRCFAARNEWHARMGNVLAGFLGITLALSVTWPGMIAYALNPNLTNPDDAYPYVISQLIPVGMRGFIFAVLIGAIMSTIDSLTNSTSSLITLDIYKKLIKKNASDKHLVIFAQICGTLILIFGALWAPMVGRFESIFAYVQECWALMIAPCVAVFLLAIFWKRATNMAAVITLSSAIPWLVIVFLRQFYGILADVNIFNLSGIVLVISLVVMAMISLFTKPAAPERLQTTTWKKEMLRLPEEEVKGKQPLWKSPTFWWAIMVSVFIFIYWRFW